jgi:hypothetical protein
VPLSQCHPERRRADDVVMTSWHGTEVTD